MFPREVINYLAFAQMQITILTLIINFYEGDIFQKTSRERDFDFQWHNGKIQIEKHCCLRWE